MKETRPFAIAVLVFAAIYAILSTTFALFVVDWCSLLGVVFFLGFELLFVGVAYDLTEMLFAAVCQPESLPVQIPLREHASVALVMTVCDDALALALDQLDQQTYPNCDVYVLDDSTDASSRAIVDQSQYTVLRRHTREGFKAGNLNNWLRRFGKKYKYLVVLDSDSLLDDDFVTRMVEYAEHPDNKDVAIFQSKILPWNIQRTFPRILGAIAPARMGVLKRTADRLGTVFSLGHNYLVRLDDVLDVGGFPENVTAEDTALTLRLSAIGQSTRLVDVTSFDAVPENMSLYARRTCRWAKQTVEMFRFPWPRASTRLKMMLCYHLYSYAIGFVYLALLLLSAWAFRAEPYGMDEIASHVLTTRLYLAPSFVILGSTALLWLFQLVSRAVLAKCFGTRFRDTLLHIVIATPLMHSFVLQQMTGMLQTALGVPVRFQPTNQRDLDSNWSSPSILNILGYMRGPVFLNSFLLLGVLLRNRYLLYGPNGFWLLLLVFSPVILWFFHRDASSIAASPRRLPDKARTGGVQ
jgi:glycosyltransferase involved in cell wall biosynthesis